MASKEQAKGTTKVKRNSITALFDLFVQSVCVIFELEPSAKKTHVKVPIKTRTTTTRKPS